MIKNLNCQLHKCRHCSFSSLDFQRIVLHEKYKHSELSKQFRCRKCYKDKMTRVEYRSHFCKPQDLRRKKILEKEAEINGEFFLCEFCGFSTKKKKTLQYHIQAYHTEHKFHCTLCKKKFVTALGLKRHLDNHVDSASRVEFLCDYCGRGFRLKDNLRNHIMGVHMHIKDSVCSICSKSFAKRNSLRQHLLLHSGKRPYTCDICGKTFVQKPALTSHRKTHPGKLPPMPVVFIDSYIKEVDPAMVCQHVLPVPKLKTQSQKFEDFQSKN